jgi:hypothetical protein
MLIKVSKHLINAKRFLQQQSEVDHAALESELNITKKEYSRYILLLEKINERVAITRKTNGRSIQDMQERITALDKEYEDLYKRILFPSLVLPAQYRTLVNKLLPILGEIVQGLPTGQTSDSIRHTYNLLFQQQQCNQTEKVKLQESIQKLVTDIKQCEHLQHSHLIAGPNCQHSWIPGYDANIHAMYQQQHEALLHEEQIIYGKIQNITIEMQSYQKILDNYNAYHMCANQYNALPLIWDYIAQHNWLYETPNRIVRFVEQLTQDTFTWDELDILIKDKKELEALLALAIRDGEGNLSTLLDTQSEYETQLGELKATEQNLTAQIEGLKRCRKAIEYIRQATDELKDMLTKRSLLVTAHIESDMQQVLNTEIKKTRIELAMLESEQVYASNKVSIINDLTAELASHTVKQQALNAILQSLSPTDGLIAKSLSGFIDSFLRDMNTIIASVWSYPLTVGIHRDLGNEYELNYRFSIRVNDEYNVSDVSKASSAMKEIIDLAFTLTVMRHLGLTDYPIYLDEFGHSMDKEHRKMAYAAINTLMAASDFSQIFIISHYEDLYRSIRNADLTVLCSNNVNLPDELQANKYTAIKRH